MVADPPLGMHGRWGFEGAIFLWCQGRECASLVGVGGVLSGYFFMYWSILMLPLMGMWALLIIPRDEKMRSNWYVTCLFFLRANYTWD